MWKAHGSRCSGILENGEMGNMLIEVDVHVYLMGLIRMERCEPVKG